MEIVGPDGKRYEVKPAKKNDHYDVYLGSDLAAGFALEADATPVWVSPAFKGRLPESSVTQIANEFVDRGGATMRML